MDKKILAAGMQKGFVGVVVAYFLAIALGILAGIWENHYLMIVVQFTSTVFIRLFKFLSIPIICVSIIVSLSTLSQSNESGRIFKHTIFYTLSTTILAACVAASLYVLFTPANVAVTGSAPDVSNKSGSHSYLDYVESIVPDNFITPFQTANVLSVLLIAAAVGIAIAKMPRGSKNQDLMITFFKASQDVLFTLVNWLIVVLPIGIFAFVASLAQEVSHGVSLGGLGTYFTLVIAANLIQMFIVLPAFLMIKGFNPIKVAKGMLPALALALAFFSKSSAATLPATMRCAQQNLKEEPQVAQFVLPMCTTINMNGCAAFIFLTVIYLMQNAGLDIHPGVIVAWIFIATLAAIGNAGVPMGCFFLSASLLASMNVPILLMGVILPFYAVVDMIETSLNVWSDSTVSVMVDKDMKKLEAVAESK